MPFTFALALIPVVGLLLFIYFNDKGEKEPFGFLVGLFFAGMGTTVSAIIIELIGGVALELVFPDTSILKAIILACIIVAPAEELGKFLIMRIMTWKSKHFDHSYDAIVYAVFVSLGFAALENIKYVFERGIGAAILRMFSAVPGHACFAVFMGFFYSKAKMAKENGKSSFGYTILALIVPILIHGVYDAILMSGTAAYEDTPVLTGLSVLLWIGFLVIMFAGSVVVIIYSSRHDKRFVPLQEEPAPMYNPAPAQAPYQHTYGQPAYPTASPFQPTYRPASSASPVQSMYRTSAAPVAAPAQPVFKPLQPAPAPSPATTAVAAAAVIGWTCSCGTVNRAKFCTECGKPRPVENKNWFCPNCGAPSHLNFCGKCGTPKPESLNR